jgi:peptide/nickel transport system substrate-binding protein
MPKPGLLFALVVFVVSCAAPAGRSGQDGTLPAQPPQVSVRTIVVAADAEIEGFGEMFAGGKSGPEHLQAMVHRPLADTDERGAFFASAAAELPSLEAGTWRILPDGRSETLWKLRPNARWHDGAALEPEDVIFSWQVAIAPDVPYRSRVVAVQIDSMEALDRQTVAIRWKSFYVGAGRLSTRDLFLLPRHRLEESFNSDRQAFVNSAFWSTDFIGVGPYRIARWEPGQGVQLEIFDGFYGERPRIPTITFKSIPDISTGIANILAGEIDVWLGSSLGTETILFLKDQYEARGGGQVITYPRQIFEIRLAPEDQRVADVRVRRALYHGMDREAIVGDLFVGLVETAHTYIIPGSSGWQEIERGITRYPYDPARAAGLLGEIGWRREGDGVLRNDRGEAFTLPFSTTTANKERESLQAVVADMWKAVGFDVVIRNAPLSVQNEASYRFATTDLSGISADFEANMPRIDGRNQRTDQNPRGANVWGYASREVDGLLDQWYRTPDRPRQIAVEAAVMQRISEDLPILPINYRFEAVTASRGLTGVPPRTATASATNTWNVERWELNQT